MSLPLLTTKWYIPPCGPDRLSRPRLLARLDAGLRPGCPLILVCAPAGYGKTSLLSEWVTARRDGATRFAWLSLEADDNDPLRFFAYLSAALDPVVPGARALVADLLAAPQAPDAATLALALVNPLANDPAPLVIILDDYQVIHERSLHAALAFLLEHLPPQTHIALATRSDPYLRLPRLRARGQVTELRLDDLRFERGETAQFFSRGGELRLSEAEIDLLDERTEGWAAGLRMALLSLRGKANPAEILQNLSGGQRYILDYLTEEALHNQSREVQDFLLYTAVLDRLCAPLCNALTGGTDGQSLLGGLERANCFLIPLDEDRTWYRYHRLFADLLWVRLKQVAQHQPGLIAHLHSRAAAWLAENGSSEEAVQHYLHAGDYARAAEIVERSAIAWLARGHLHQLLAWIRRLPDGLAAQRPWLNIAQAWGLAFAGLPTAETETHLAQAEAALAAGALSAPEQARIRAEMHAIRSMLIITGGNIPAALDLIAQPAEIVPSEAGFARSIQRWAVGYALRIHGDLAEAAACFNEVLQIGYRLDNLWTIVSASVDLGAVLRLQGHLDQAAAVYQAGLARAYQASGGPGFVGRLEAFFASLRMERGELEEAQTLIDQSLEHNRRWENPNHCAYAWLVQARLHLHHRRPERAFAALSEAQTWVERGGVIPTLRAMIAQTQIRAWLQGGGLEHARAWLAEQAFPALAPGAPLPEMEEIRRVGAARILLADARPQAARDLLAPLAEAARRGGKLTTLIEVRVLQACADPGAGVQFLREALTLGLPRGYRQVFLDEGPLLRPALEACQDLAGVSDLLNALHVQEEAAQPAPGLLTGREVEILRWMAAGLSNPEIGKRLFIAPGTVKAHTATIYRKLDAANRAEAIARAKDLGLL